MMMISTMNERQRSVMVPQKASVEKTRLCLHDACLSICLWYLIYVSKLSGWMQWLRRWFILFGPRTSFVCLGWVYELLMIGASLFCSLLHQITKTCWREGIANIHRSMLCVHCFGFIRFFRLSIFRAHGSEWWCWLSNFFSFPPFFFFLFLGPFMHSRFALFFSGR